MNVLKDKFTGHSLDNGSLDAQDLGIKSAGTGEIPVKYGFDHHSDIPEAVGLFKRNRPADVERSTQ